VKVGGLSEVSVHAKNEIYEILKKGSAKRQTAATKLNACSSRSHTIFAVTVRMKDVVNLMDGEEVYRIGKLNLVDLAGSENIGRSGAVEKRATEAGNINKSLLTLGRVITSLVDKNSHIPYRESKLTRLLQDSLGGRTKTSIIATISPNCQDLEDSISTLEYAQRAKKITNKPELNQKMTKNTVLKELTAEIERLRRDVEAGRGGSDTFYVSKANYEDLLQKEKELELKLQMVKDLETELEDLKCKFGETEADLEKKKELLIETREILHQARTELHHVQVALRDMTNDRDEQQFLVQNHVKTEQILTSQASQLVTVADTATDHVHRLHAKVDRVLTLENSNLTKAAQHAQEMVESLSETCESVKKIDTGFLEEAEQKLTHGSQSLLSGLDAVTAKLRQIESGLREEIDSQVGRISEGKSSLTGCLDQVTEAIELVRSEQQKSVTLLKGLVSQRTQEVSSEISAIMQILSEEREKEEQMLMRQSQLILESQNIRAQVISELKQGIVDEFASQKAELDFFKKQVNDLTKKLEEQKYSRKSLMEECMRQFVESVAKSAAACSAHVLDQVAAAEETGESEIRSFVSPVTESIDHQVQQSGPRMHQRCGDVDAKFVSLEKNEISMSEHNNDTDRCIAEHHQKRVDRLQDLDSHSQGRNEELQSLLDSQFKSETENLLNALKLQSDVKKKVIQSADDEVRALQSLERDMTDKSSETLSQVETVAQNVSDLVKELNAELNMEKIHKERVEKELLQKLARQSQDVMRLPSDLQRDVPTGETPQKVTYEYTRVLARTSPHTKIVDRFRQDRISAQTELATKCPLPDDANSEDSDLNSRPASVASTSSEGSSIENKHPRNGSSKLPKIQSSGSLAQKVKQQAGIKKSKSTVAQGDVLRQQKANY
jgi:kinesin family protein 11